MLLYKIIEKPVLIGDFKMLEINTDSLIVTINNDIYQIPYYDIEQVSVYRKNNKDHLRIVYSGRNKSKKETFTIGNVNSPQIIMDTLLLNIKKEKNIFVPTKIAYQAKTKENEE